MGKRVRTEIQIGADSYIVWYGSSDISVEILDGGDGYIGLYTHECVELRDALTLFINTREER